MSIERWRDVEDYIHYSVSDTGRVRSKARGSWRELKPYLDRSGYERVLLSNNGVKRNHIISRLVAKAFVDGYEESYQVNHLDGNKRNNHYTNLEWTTPSGNTKHACDTGLARPQLNGKKTSKRVRVVETGQIFESESECARSIGVKREGINACVNGRLKTHHGYHYELVD